MKHPTPPLVRIRERLATVAPDPDTGCIEWPGAKQNGGYGHVGAGRREDGNVRVARVVLEDALGRPIRGGMYALHRCDNPPCCNPDHLYEGTPRQNQRDAADRGRRAVGEGHPNARLTESQVRAIRADTRSGVEIARQYGISDGMVSMIRTRKRWAHVPD